MSWVNVGNIKGDTGSTGATGATGKGISSIVGTTGNDATTVAVSFDDGSSTSFEVMNGQPGYYVDVNYGDIVWESGKKAYEITFRFYKPDGTLNTTKMYAMKFDKTYPNGYFAGNVRNGTLTLYSFDPEDTIKILVGLYDSTNNKFTKVYYRILHLATGPSTINVNGKLDINFNGTAYTTAKLYPARNDVLSSDTDIKLKLIPIDTYTVEQTVTISNGYFDLANILDPTKAYICNLGVTDSYGNIIRYTSTFIIPAMKSGSSITVDTTLDDTSNNPIANAPVATAIEDLQTDIGTITSAQQSNLNILGS